jgi:hypothetical protein
MIARTLSILLSVVLGKKLAQQVSINTIDQSFSVNRDTPDCQQPMTDAVNERLQTNDSW